MRVNTGGRALNELGGLALTKLNQTPNASVWSSNRLEHNSRTAGDEIRSQKGNSPDHRLRSPSVRSVGNDVGLLKQPGGWLRSSHPLKSA